MLRLLTLALAALVALAGGQATMTDAEYKAASDALSTAACALTDWVFLIDFHNTTQLHQCSAKTSAAATPTTILTACPVYKTITVFSQADYALFHADSSSNEDAGLVINVTGSVTRDWPALMAASDVVTIFVASCQNFTFIEPFGMLLVTLEDPATVPATGLCGQGEGGHQVLLPSQPNADFCASAAGDNVSGGALATLAIISAGFCVSAFVLVWVVVRVSRRARK